MYNLLIKHQIEEFEDTKAVIRIRKSKDRQHNNKKKKDKRTNNDLQNKHIKLKMEQQEPTRDSLLIHFKQEHW